MTKDVAPEKFHVTDSPPDAAEDNLQSLLTFLGIFRHKVSTKRLSYDGLMGLLTLSCRRMEERRQRRVSESCNQSAGPPQQRQQPGRAEGV